MLNRSDLRADLAEVRSSCVAFYGLGVDAFHPVMVRPSLGFSLVPKPRRRTETGETARDPEARRREAIARALAPIRAADAGLVEGSDFDASAGNSDIRHGMGGLSAAGALRMEDLCSLVRQDRGLYAIWTVTMPVEVALALDAIENGAQKLSDAIRRRFGEELRRSCRREAKRLRVPVPDHWWFVIEPQKAGRPHWHFVFRCKARRGRGWLLGKGRLDRLIASAFRTVTGVVIPVKSAGNVQALRRDPGRYLSKYLRKGQGCSGADAVLRNGWSLNLVPLRWWGCSRSALAFLREFTFPLPSLAVGWLSKQWPSLARVGALDARLWTPEADGAPTIVCGRWHGPQGLVDVVRHLFQLAERAYGSGRTYGYN